MAHFIYEYSANLPSTLLDLQTLMAKMHATAARTGVFPQSGMRSRAFRCDEFYLADGDPAKRILEYAKEEAVDCIIMGSRGLGDLKALLQGSVSRKVSNRAPCTCVTVR